jgi:hypothetical protein
MTIDDEKIDNILIEHRKESEIMCKRLKDDMDLKFGNIFETGNEILKTLGVISADIKIILSDLQGIKEILK